MGYRTPLESRIAKKTTRAILEYGMVEDGDRVMVGLSGGKDSWALLEMLHVLRQRAPIRFSIIAVNVDSGYKEYKHDLIRSTCEARGWDLRIEHTAIGEVMDDLLEADATPCSLCARLRRGVLYRIAGGGRGDQDRARPPRRRFHRDTAHQPLLRGRHQGHAGAPALRQRPPRRRAALRVRQRRRGAALHEGSGPAGDRVLLPGVRRSSLQRQRIKRMLMQLEREHPGVKASLLKALGNVMPRHLLDRRLNPPPRERRRQAGA